jgi:hypothetical protein
MLHLCVARHRSCQLETIVFFVSWLALAILGAGLLPLAWERLLATRWGWLVARVFIFAFLLLGSIYLTGLLILSGRDWLLVH